MFDPQTFSTVIHCRDICRDTAELLSVSCAWLVLLSPVVVVASLFGGTVVLCGHIRLFAWVVYCMRQDVFPVKGQNPLLMREGPK